MNKQKKHRKKSANGVRNLPSYNFISIYFQLHYHRKRIRYIRSLEEAEEKLCAMSLKMQTLQPPLLASTTLFLNHLFPFLVLRHYLEVKDEKLFRGVKKKNVKKFFSFLLLLLCIYKIPTHSEHNLQWRVKCVG